MTADHATLRDLVSFFLAVGLFGLVLFVPGFVLGWLCDVLDFRRRPLATQLALGVLLSVAVLRLR